jgi:hypothetical protein
MRFYLEPWTCKKRFQFLSFITFQFFLDIGFFHAVTIDKGVAGSILAFLGSRGLGLVGPVLDTVIWNLWGLSSLAWRARARERERVRARERESERDNIYVPKKRTKTTIETETEKKVKKKKKRT